MLIEESTSLRAALEAQIVSLRAHAEVKNEAQDDAIFGLDAKVEAHEAAIQELAEYLRQVLQHPLMRPSMAEK